MFRPVKRQAARLSRPVSARPCVAQGSSVDEGVVRASAGVLMSSEIVLQYKLSTSLLKATLIKWQQREVWSIDSV
jgi:hypothetical protein